MTDRKLLITPVTDYSGAVDFYMRRTISMFYFFFLCELMALLPASGASAVDQNAKSPTLTLTAPREVHFGQEAIFVATLKPASSGQVEFVLESFAGEPIWSKTVMALEGKATVALDATEAVKLDKESYLLEASLIANAQCNASASVRLRGKIFRNVMEAPSEMQPGDEIVITDTSLFGPVDSICDVSTQGKWWRRAYRLEGSEQEQTLLCVLEHNIEDPQSCLAGQLTLPLRLEGWYEIWARTYRQQPNNSDDMRTNGGIDVRLSGEKYFLHANPLQVNTKPAYPRPHYETLVDMRYRAADMTGQSLVFQQPFGTYESVQKKCNAVLAGVRLKKLSVNQVTRLNRERTNHDIRRIGYDNDGFSGFWKWGAHDEASIARLLEPLRDQSTEFFNISLGGVGGLIIPTPYTEMYQMHGHTRDGDMRVNAFYRWCFENEVNIVDVLSKRAHEVDLKLFVSLMAERCYSPDKTVKEHPEWKIKRGRGVWNYANPGVHDYQVKKITWICENHDIDGFIVDFTRYGHHFNQDEPNKFKHMNTYLRKLRQSIDKVNAKRDRHIRLCGSFGDRSWHLLHWGSGILADQGLDVETWLEEGIFDILMPEGPTALDFVKMAKGKKSRTEVWPRKVSNVDFQNHRYFREQEGPKEIEQGAKDWLDQNASGIFMFNHDTWTTLSRLGFSDELVLRTKSNQEIYGMREAAKIRFTTWYPSSLEAERQRSALKPLTVAADIRKHVDATLLIPIHNTFKHPVTVTVSWSNSEDEVSENRQLKFVPVNSSVEIEPDKTGKLAFQVQGNIAAQLGIPRAVVHFSHLGQPIFHSSLPVRTVPKWDCKRIDSAPIIDGQFGDPAWKNIGGLKSSKFFTLGETPRSSTKIKLALGYDDQNLYLAYKFTGDVSRAERQIQQRDSRKIHDGDNIQFLFDTTGSEQQYKKFAVSPSGGSAEDLMHYDSFAGHFKGSRVEGNAKWTVGTAIRKHSYSVEIAIPWKELGTTPIPGDEWRMNVVGRSLDRHGKPIVSSWSSSESAFHLPRRFGHLFGLLKFE